MKTLRRITLFVLIVAMLACTCACGETKARYKTTTKKIHVPETVTETKVTGQRIVGYETIYLSDGTKVDYDDIKDADDFEDLPQNSNGGTESTPHKDTSSNKDTSSDKDTSSNNDTSSNKDVSSDKETTSNEDTSSDNENTESNEPVKPMTDNFIEDGYFNYRLIRSARSGDAVTIIAKTLNNSIKEELKCNTNYKTDVIAPNANIRELLIGSTNRAASVVAENKLKAKHALCYYDAVVCTVGNDICIFGYERYALTNAVNWFLETYCDGKTLKVPSKIEKYFINEDKNPVAVKIGDTPISEYRIVIPSNAGNIIKGAAGYLQRNLELYASAALNIVYDSVAKSDKEINIGPTNRNIAAPENKDEGYRRVSKGSLYYSSKNDDLVYMMVRDLAESLAVENGGTYTVNGALNETVTYEGLRGSFGNGYNLVWYDEFDGDTLNPNFWHNNKSASFAAATGSRTNWDNKYAVLKDGILNLVETRVKQKVFTNAGIMTANKVYFLYGYMELKVKITEGNSYAAWWLNSALRGDYRPEIDMYETFNNPKTLVTNLHTWDDPAIPGGHIDHYADADNSEWTINRRYNAPGSEMLADKWRIVGLEWTPDMITVYCDGEAYCSWDISETNTGDRYKAFRGIPCQMIIDCSTANSNEFEIGESRTHMIDYVRVWQRAESQTGYKSYVSNGQSGSAFVDMSIPNN